MSGELNSMSYRQLTNTWLEARPRKQNTTGLLLFITPGRRVYIPSLGKAVLGILPLYNTSGVHSPKNVLLNTLLVKFILVTSLFESWIFFKKINYNLVDNHNRDLHLRNQSHISNQGLAWAQEKGKNTCACAYMHIHTHTPATFAIYNSIYSLKCS